MTISRPAFSAGRLILICLFAVAAAAFSPAAASASSIVYIKDGNVWLSSGDAATSRQVTSGGNWHSPTQADDGTIAAVQGADSPITVMNPYGQVIRTIQTPSGAATSNGGTFAARPVNLDFSPDGSKIAYDYSTESCPVASSCGAQSSTFYTWADHSTPISEFGNQYGRSNPSFITSNRALTFGGFLSQVNIDDLGGGDYSDVHWFDDMDIFANDTDVSDGELSRQGDRLVTLRGYGSSTYVQMLKVTGNAATAMPTLPEPACQVDQKDANDADPTWSPDGQHVAYAATGGIMMVNLPAVQAGSCPGASGADKVVIPGGSEPDWGPADVPVGDPPKVGPDPGPATNDDDAACVAAQAKLDKAKAKLKKAKAKGKRSAVAKAKDKLKGAKAASKQSCA